MYNVIMIQHRGLSPPVLFARDEYDQGNQNWISDTYTTVSDYALLLYMRCTFAQSLTSLPVSKQEVAFISTQRAVLIHFVCKARSVNCSPLHVWLSWNHQIHFFFFEENVNNYLTVQRSCCSWILVFFFPTQLPQCIKYVLSFCSLPLTVRALKMKSVHHFSF